MPAGILKTCACPSDGRVSHRHRGRREFVENFTHEEMAAHVHQRQGIGVIRGWRAPEYKWTRSLEGLCNIVYKLDSARLVVQVGKISPFSLSLSLSFDETFSKYMIVERLPNKRSTSSSRTNKANVRRGNVNFILSVPCVQFV